MATHLTGRPRAAGSEDLQELARRHLWMHFTRMGAYAEHEVPIIVRGDGCHV
ncbi:MAG: aspartate aminotransferase family protein, partial [Actinobacteria bacterium]|nr:aspartate aminotransferase family protein [Actinomycetota bacterium]